MKLEEDSIFEKAPHKKPTLRELAEERLKNRSISSVPLDIDQAKRLIHELQVHQIELELQNEELKRIQEELQAARSLYHDLYTFAPVGYVTLTEDLLIENINPAGAEILAGYKTAPHQYFGRAFTEYIHPDSQDALYLFVQDLKTSKDKQSIILRIRSTENQPVYIKTEAVKKVLETGKCVLFCTFLNITDRIVIEEELKKSLQIKELLLRELNHRVKNNLQMISSLIFLQKNTKECQETHETLEKIQSRIKSIAIVYEMLQKSEQIGKVNLKEYCYSLTQRILENYIQNPGRVDVLYDLDEVWIDTDRIVSLGQVVNEILLNALKHAFPGTASGTLTLRLKDLKNGSILLQIRDTGPGIPDTVLKGNSDTLGFQIMQGLVSKLNGTLEIKNEGGALYSLTLPLTD